MNSFKYILVGVALAAFIAACGSAKTRTPAPATAVVAHGDSYGTGSYGTGDWRSHRPHHHTSVKGVA